MSTTTICGSSKLLEGHIGGTNIVMLLEIEKTGCISMELR